MLKSLSGYFIETVFVKLSITVSLCFEIGPLLPMICHLIGMTWASFFLPVELVVKI